ncbi:MAG TPA: copper homeostasis protein CutC [Gemmatimonadaceae bacterium]|nr:copper homeostasis protein CutC [Gemmatimonadaceae bacterium]
MLLEACLDSLELAARAEQGGAGRIELCDRLDVGGTTPTRGLIERVVGAVGIPVFPIIRPRGGDFFHSADEVESMKRDVEVAAKAGAAGIVLGILHPDRTIDAERTRSVMDVAPHLPATFHLAFDQAPDPGLALETLVHIGIARVLTRGGGRTALDGVEGLRRLVGQSAGRIHIMAGGGVREDNAEEIVRRSGVREIHSRGTAVAEMVAAAKRGTLNPRSDRNTRTNPDTMRG